MSERSNLTNLENLSRQRAAEGTIHTPFPWSQFENQFDHWAQQQLEEQSIAQPPPATGVCNSAVDSEFVKPQS